MDKVQRISEQTDDLQEVIKALETTPSNEEVYEAVAALRRDKVNKATANTIKSAQFDRLKVAGQWISEKQCAAAKKTYTGELLRFFARTVYERGRDVYQGSRYFGHPSVTTT